MMTATGIDGVSIVPLKRLADDRGMVMHMLRADDPHFDRFGEIYFSLVGSGALKAWRLHRRITLNYAVPMGTIRLVLFDDRPGSPSRGRVLERVIGEPDYCLVTIPPGIWSGFRGESPGPALVANCATEPHDATEEERRDGMAPEIPYQWPVVR
jgi:dTDP-4-dehydrorhamnose 3,5-epimerase